MPSSRFMLPLLSISIILLLIAHQFDFSSSSSLPARPPKVFVIGLSKTGTTSIGDALEILGYRRLGWADTRSRIMVHTWMNGNKATNFELSQLWDAFEDLPWPVMYREMAEKYPDAKFLLSRRKDEETWLQSMAVHVGRGKWKPYAYFYGADTFEGNEDIMRQAYRGHMREVRAFFNDKPGRLWEMSIDDDGDVNWDVLCQIASCPGGKPPKVQFPRSNTQATWERGWLDESRRGVEGWIVTRIEELIAHHCYHGEWQVLVKPLMRAIGKWQLTSKLLISKHQQVQLLEAASVLVAMNQDGPDSDNSSSPAASGSSDMRDEDLSSTETTPPPQGDNAYRDSSKRFSNNSSVFSRSYQSAFSESVPEHGFSHNRHWSTSSGRPLTAGSNFAESYTGNEDAQDLAAAVGLLSCSYGTPKSAPSALPMDAPPVPPLPAKYQTGYSNFRGQGNDVDMEDEISSDDEPHHPRNDDVDDGMFGKMDA
ncbi:hypothetical protein TI39_contig598g00020 [Zymoseptoria brevis]|uniref:P-loop containing nucleoside triphosphate hydrolase protein n=1 Tax=Zymoseptoria brevis TaxID=1047168 RepID=A0A0F4GHS3_9PEZI|nr:hypothetical protein TI39_contig598g00020 [Zymoseptoria brevis]